LHPYIICLQERREAPLIKAFLDMVEDQNKKGT